MKKLLSCLVSVGVLASTATAFAASSAFNPNKDPNGDGHLTIADSAFIKQFLVGKYEVSDLTQLDVDDNDVVSDVDDVYVRMYDAGMLSSTEQTAEPANISNTSTSRNYRVYNAQSGVYRRNYSLTVTNLDNSTNTRTIFGDNSQQLDWENIGVAKLMTNNAYLGSGFVVGPHTIATAAHCVYYVEGDYAKLVNEILLFDQQGNAIPCTPVETHVPSSYVNSSYYNENYDYALVTVEEDVSEFMTFNLGSITDNAPINHLEVTAIGFPQTANNLNNSASINNKIKSEGTLMNGNNGGYIISHTADTISGSSGCPIFITETVNNQTYYTVIGINVIGVGQTHNYTYNYNGAVRFTPHILKFLNGNSNIQY